MSTLNVWMPLYIGDYLADTMHLNTAQHGAYLLVLMHYWRSGPPLNDDNLLAGIVRVERKVWDKNLREVVRAFFHVGSDGRLHQKRMDAERERVCDLSDKRRSAGKKRGPRGGGKPNGTSSKTAAKDQQTTSNSYRNSDSSDPAIAKQTTHSCSSNWVDTCASHAGASHPQLHSQRYSDHRRSDAGASRKPDVRSELWSAGLVSLRGLTGLPEGKARSELGKLCKVAGDDCATVSRALDAAADLRPGDPVAWLTRACADAKPDPFAWVEEMAEQTDEVLS